MITNTSQSSVRATRVEDAVWRYVSELLKDPDRIRAGIEELIEQERAAAHGDPEPEAELWEEKIAECSRLRSAYQDQQAAGLSGEERMRVYEMLQLEVRADPEGYEVSGVLCNSRPRGRGRSESTKPTELRFCALLTEGDARVRFHREEFNRLKENST